jgi:hypothetical protein
MANSTSNIDPIVNGQGAQHLTANAFFDSASMATLYGRRMSTCAGLTWGYYGGNVLINGTTTAIANSTLLLTASVTNYVEADRVTGAVTTNSTGFTVGKLRLYAVVTGTTTVTSWTDYRDWGAEMSLRLTLAMSDANTTLTTDQARCKILEFTGTLTTTRNIVLPLVPYQWTVYNATSRPLQFIGASGTGITVVSGKRAIVYSNGTNIVAATVTVDDVVPAAIITESTTARTLAITDVGAWIRSTNTAATTITIPLNSSVAFVTGTSLNGVQAAAGQNTIAATGGVTLNVPTGYVAKTRAKGGVWSIIKVATDEWDLMGDLEAAP